MSPPNQEKTPHVVVIGHYPEYLVLAERLGATFFSVSQEIWDTLNEDGRWQLNRSFLDHEIERGSIFILATPMEELRRESWLEREIQYLLNHGFTYHESTHTFSR